MMIVATIRFRASKTEREQTNSETPSFGGDNKEIYSRGSDKLSVLG